MNYSMIFCIGCDFGIFYDFLWQFVVVFDIHGEVCE